MKACFHSNLLFHFTQVEITSWGVQIEDCALQGRILKHTAKKLLDRFSNFDLAFFWWLPKSGASDGSCQYLFSCKVVRRFHELRFMPCERAWKTASAKLKLRSIQ